MKHNNIFTKKNIYKILSYAVFLVSIIPNIIIAQEEFLCFGIDYEHSYFNFIFVIVVSLLFYKSKDMSIRTASVFEKYRFSAVFFLGLVVSSFFAYRFVFEGICLSVGDIPASINLFFSNIFISIVLIVVAGERLLNKK